MNHQQPNMFAVVGACCLALGALSASVQAQELPPEVVQAVRDATGIELNATARLQDKRLVVRVGPPTDNQPRIIGGGWFDHVTVEPITGEVLGVLFQSQDGNARGVPARRKDSSRERLVRIDWDVLDRLDPKQAENRLAVPLFDGEAIEVNFFSCEQRSPTSFTWFGRIGGQSLSDVVLVREDDAVHMQIRDYATPGMWQLRRADANAHVLREMRLPADKGNWCATGRAAVEAAAPPNDRGGLAGGMGGGGGVPEGGYVDPVNEVDIMIVATNQALAEYGSAAAFRAGAQAMIADFNMRCSNSTVDAHVRLCHLVANSGYNEDDDGGVDLARITDDKDGHLDWVHAARTESRADLVALIREDSWDCDIFGTCSFGVAWRPSNLTLMSTGLPNNIYEGGYGFSVTCLAGSDPARTFSHEVGHNYGACHNAETGACDSTITDSARGIYRECDIIIACTTAYTTMSYNPGCLAGNTAIPYWSRQNLYYDIDGDGCDPHPMWDAQSMVQNLIFTSRGTLAQNRIGGTQKWTQCCVPNGNGTYIDPFNSVRLGVMNVQGGVAEGVVMARSATYNETGAIGGQVVLSNPCKIEAVGGPVTLQ